VFIKIFRFVISLFIIFKVFDTTQIVRVTNFVDSLARRRQVFEDIKFFASNRLVNLVWTTILIKSTWKDIRIFCNSLIVKVAYACFANAI